MRVDTAFQKDGGKLQWNLIQWMALTLVARVAEEGAKKYGKRNWEKHVNEWEWTRHWDSAMRHMVAWLLGEDDDPEDKLPHLAHAAWRILTLIELIQRGHGIDDRSELKTDVQKLFGYVQADLHKAKGQSSPHIIT